MDVPRAGVGYGDAVDRHVVAADDRQSVRAGHAADVLGLLHGEEAALIVDRAAARDADVAVALAAATPDVHDACEDLFDPTLVDVLDHREVGEVVDGAERGARFDAEGDVVLAEKERSGEVVAGRNAHFAVGRAGVDGPLNRLGVERATVAAGAEVAHVEDFGGGSGPQREGFARPLLAGGVDGIDPHAVGGRRLQTAQTQIVVVGGAGRASVDADDVADHPFVVVGFLPEDDGFRGGRRAGKDAAPDRSRGMRAEKRAEGCQKRCTVFEHGVCMDFG